MRLFSKLFQILIAAAALSAISPVDFAFAQSQHEYTPSGRIPTDDERFVAGTDRAAGLKALDSMMRYNQYMAIGADIGSNWNLDNTLRNDHYAPNPPGVPMRYTGNYGRDPWTCGNPNTDFDWKMDTIAMLGLDDPSNYENFMGCFVRNVVDDVRPPSIWGSEGRPSFNYPEVCIDTSWGVAIKIDVREDPPPSFARFLPPWAMFLSPVLNEVRGYGDEHVDLFCCPNNSLILEECGWETGYHAEIAWPSHEVGLNNAGKSAFDPTYECGNDGYGARLDEEGNPVWDDSYDSQLINQFRERYGIGRPEYTGPRHLPSAVPAYPGTLRSSPHFMKTHWDGIQPGDQFYQQEAHVYQTFLDKVASMNMPDPNRGFQEDCRCFFNTVGKPERRIVTGWTEKMPYRMFWRAEEMSAMMGMGAGVNPIFGVATPAITDVTQTRFARYDLLFPAEKSCAAYRATRWPLASDLGTPAADGGAYLGRRSDNYIDLVSALGVRPGLGPMAAITDFSIDFTSNWLGMYQIMMAKQCLRGGGDVYPITGKLAGHYNELTAGALLARRAVELFSQHPNYNSAFIGVNNVYDRPHYFGDNFDKLQRIYPRLGEVRPPEPPVNRPVNPEIQPSPTPTPVEPEMFRSGLASACFKTQEIPNYGIHEVNTISQVGSLDWPTDLIHPNQQGEKRYAVWERQRLCMCPQAGAVRAWRFFVCTSGCQTCARVRTFCQRTDDSCLNANDGDYEDYTINFRTDGNNTLVDFTQFGQMFPYPFIEASCAGEIAHPAPCQDATLGMCPPGGGAR